MESDSRSDVITRKRVAIQGGYGAFHEIAALHYFGKEVEIIPSNTFRDLFKSLKTREADFGIMAIENLVAGSIIPNYNLLRDSNMKITGEIYLRIQQNLVALPGQKFEELREVYSHPMAILQCQAFFEQYPDIRLIESLDTALSAKKIREENLIGVGAISSHQAAAMYNLEILKESIETNKMNYTRFLILTDKEETVKYPGPINKTSICFALAHEIGSLSKILSILSYFNMNLSKIQSIPIVGKEWEYLFYVDIEVPDMSLYRQAIESIKPFTSDLKTLGEYCKGQSII